MSFLNKGNKNFITKGKQTSNTYNQEFNGYEYGLMLQKMID